LNLPSVPLASRRLFCLSVAQAILPVPTKRQSTIANPQLPRALVLFLPFAFSLVALASCRHLLNLHIAPLASGRRLGFSSVTPDLQKHFASLI
jgi:hypothetical protein